MKFRTLTILSFLSIFFAYLNAQTPMSNTFYASQFPGITVGAKVTAAQGACNSNPLLTCVIVIDPDLGAWATGNMPTKCTQCVWIDYRTTSPFGVGGGGSLSGLTTGYLLKATSSTGAGNSSVDEGVTLASWLTTSLSGGFQATAFKSYQGTQGYPAFIFSGSNSSTSASNGIYSIGTNDIGFGNGANCIGALSSCAWTATIEATQFLSHQAAGSIGVAEHVPYNALTGISYNSPLLEISGAYEASASSTYADNWDFGVVIGTGINPTSVLTLTHSGTPGAASLSIPFPVTTGKLYTPASTTTVAGINLPHGTAPTSPLNGDCWTTTAGLYCYINGATIGPYGVGGGGMTYPGAGVPNSTGTAWGTSYSAAAGGAGLTTGPLSGTVANQFVWWSNTTGAVTGSGYTTGTSGAAIPLLSGANTWSALQTFSNGATVANPLNITYAGGSSVPTGVYQTGSLYSGGTGTTTKPYWNISLGGTAVNTWNVNGTVFGINFPSASAASGLDFHINGGASTFKVLANGATTSANIGGSASDTLTAGAAAGTSPTIACTGSHLCTDISGTIIVTTGTAPPIGVLVTVTMVTTRTNVPDCVAALYPATAGVPSGAQITTMYPVPSTTNLAFTVTATLSASTNYALIYSCGGN